ncbi:hypothetical protein WJX74_009956 [Apatococcus lobatus]|uniref:Uncharacterized protein n=1 Tax=Apatococcus lobatus TaxID=904363 RepID=A0AAW1RJD2_9CHLO
MHGLETPPAEANHGRLRPFSYLALDVPNNSSMRSCRRASRWIRSALLNATSRPGVPASAPLHAAEHGLTAEGDVAAAFHLTPLFPSSFAAAAILGGAVAGALSIACCAEERLDRGVLQQLARDLSSNLNADKERAVSMLSTLTPYMEHHEALLEADVLICIMKAVEDETIIPQVRVLALCCAADLMKDKTAHHGTVCSHAFLTMVMAALKSEGAWGEGPEDGLMARSHACRLLSELCSDGRCHPILIEEGAARILVEQGAQVAIESEKSGSTYASVSAAPANYNAIHNMEVERYLSASLFGLASSAAGRDTIASAEARIVRGMATWTCSRDPILQRYGVGGIARLASVSAENVALVQRAGALPALVKGLNIPDAQAQCFASGAVGRIAEIGGEAASTLIQHGAASGLLQMLTEKQAGQPNGVFRGVQRCALRSMQACSRTFVMQQALLSVGANAALQEILTHADLSQELQSLTQDTLQLLS